MADCYSPRIHLAASEVKAALAAEPGANVRALCLSAVERHFTGAERRSDWEATRRVGSGPTFSERIRRLVEAP